jgi:ribosome-binding factor A
MERREFVLPKLSKDCYVVTYRKCYYVYASKIRKHPNLNFERDWSFNCAFALETIITSLF